MSECCRPATPLWRRRPAGELLAVALAEADLPQADLVFDRPRDGERAMVGDPVLLGRVLQQLRRALDRYAPAAEFRLAARIRRDTELELAFVAPGLEGGRVARTRLASPDVSDEGELPRLVRFSLSRELLGILGGRIELGGEDDTVLRLILPLRQAAQPVLTGVETPS